VSVFAEVKKRLPPLEEYASELTELKRSGGVLVGHCPLADHVDTTPSFNVWPGNDSWWCFGCCRGSDIFDLYAYIEGCSEPWEALVGLSLKYGIELPARSETWRRWQGEKHAIEDLAENVRFQVRCRRLFKATVLNTPEIRDIEDPAERREEIRRCWQAFEEGLRDISRKMKRQSMRRLSR
jgi:hypothetical protein